MRRSVPLLLAGSVAAPLLAVAAPASASTATATTATAGYLKELHDAATPTGAASASGWRLSMTATTPAGVVMTATDSFDVATRTSREAVSVGRTTVDDIVAVTGRGSYEHGTILGSVELTDLALLHKSWVFSADSSADAAGEVKDSSPAGVLASVGQDGAVTSASRTTGSDGSHTYVVHSKNSLGTYTETYGLDPAGRLSHASATGPGAGVTSATLDPAYGPQTIARPTPAQYATNTELARVAAEIAALPTRVRASAGSIVTGAKAAAARAHRSALRPSDMVEGAAYARRHRTTTYVTVSISAMRGGYRVSATNPYTRKAVVKTVLLVRGGTARIV